MYRDFPGKKIATLALKFVEDRFCYGQISDWNEIISYFDMLREGEQKFGIAVDRLQEWHNLLQRYFSLGPTLENIRYFLEYCHLSAETVDGVLTYISEMEKNADLMQKVSEFFEQFSELVHQ